MYEHRIPAGEFVLGQPNGYGRLTPWPTLPGSVPDPDFGRNGTYLVFRQLAQDVAAFWRYLDEQTGGDADARTRLGAKLVGRWPSGAPITRADGPADPRDPRLALDNDFGYDLQDRYGLHCPVGAHIRRTNPRDSLGALPDDELALSAAPDDALRRRHLHRIIRRGRVYGPGLDRPLDGDDGQARGLLFLGLCANLERQFEFIQRTWCNNAKFASLYERRRPPDRRPAGRPGHLHAAARPRTAAAGRAAELRHRPRRRLLLPTRHPRPAPPGALSLTPGGRCGRPRWRPGPRRPG